MNRMSRQRTRSNLRVFGGRSHTELTHSIARKVGVRVGEVVLGKFANNETNVSVKENVRGQDIYILQTGGGPRPNDDLMELLLLINTFKLSTANVINVIIPYFFYSKGDKKDSFKRVPITAKLVANMLIKAGADHITIIDPHTPQLEGFFDTPVDALKVEPLFCNWIKKHVDGFESCVVVAPDEGGAKRCASLANELDLEFALINNRWPDNAKHKWRRQKSNTTTSSNVDSSERSDADDVDQLDSTKALRRYDGMALTLNVLTENVSQGGSLAGRTAIIVDDMLDTGKTAKKSIDTLKKIGAQGVYVLVTHGIFSGDSIRYLKSQDDFLRAVVTTNTVPQARSLQELGDRLHVIDVSGLIAEYIRRHHYHESVSVLGHFMPVREEAGPDRKNDAIDDDLTAESASNDDDGEKSETDDASMADDDGSVGSETDNRPPSEQANNLRLLKLRKGFRLSSMCWDD